ncbi:unnamed protein product [marine sediment metagenome]|uniref:Uncharacterized protein n=1 Tax=marine sediment metagenome TaxID=412755 RepID=X0T7E9_9ZZZZ
MPEGHMINNSTWYRWDRLATKSLDQQFINEIDSDEKPIGCRL